MRYLVSLFVVALLSASSNGIGQTFPPQDLEVLKKVAEGLKKVEAALKVIESMPDSEEKIVLHDGLNAAFQTMAILSGLTRDPGPPTEAPKASVKVGDKIPEITLRNGAKFEAVTVKSFDLGSAVLSHSKGMARVPLVDLADEWRVIFGYDPILAAQSEALEQAKVASIPKLAPAPPIEARVGGVRPANLKDGINLYGIDAKEVQVRSGDLTEISWKVTVYNKGPNAIRDISLRFLFKDAGGFQVEEAFEYPLSFEVGEERVITGTSLIRNAVWATVESFEVITR